MLRVGTTAPLIKFPRLIPADPLIALSHQAPQGDRGQGPGWNNKQTFFANSGHGKNSKMKKKKAKRESEKLEMKQGEMRCMRWGGAGAAARSTCVDKQTDPLTLPNNHVETTAHRIHHLRFTDRRPILNPTARCHIHYVKRCQEISTNKLSY